MVEHVSEPSTPPPQIEALDRGLRILEALGQARPEGLQLGALARALGANKSTSHRALASLKRRDFVLQDPITGAYRLGPRLALLVDQQFGQDNLPDLLAPTLERICREVDELVHLGVLNIPWVVYIAKVEPEHAVRVWSQVGSRAPAATTALGRAMLACLPDLPFSKLQAVFGRTIERARLETAITQARERGFAAETEENEPGVACVAVALTRRGSPCAAVSLTAPAERLTPARGAHAAQIARRILEETLPPGLALSPALLEA